MVFLGLEFDSLVFFLVAVIGFFLRFEDDSIESAKTVKQWNVKIISVRNLTLLFLHAVMLGYDLLNRGTCSVFFFRLVRISGIKTGQQP